MPVPGCRVVSEIGTLHQHLMRACAVRIPASKSCIVSFIWQILMKLLNNSGRWPLTTKLTGKNKRARERLTNASLQNNESWIVSISISVFTVWRHHSPKNFLMFRRHLTRVPLFHRNRAKEVGIRSKKPFFATPKKTSEATGSQISLSGQAMSTQKWSLNNRRALPVATRRGAQTHSNPGRCSTVSCSLQPRSWGYPQS